MYVLKYLNYPRISPPDLSFGKITFWGLVGWEWVKVGLIPPHLRCYPPSHPLHPAHPPDMPLWGYLRLLEFYHEFKVLFSIPNKQSYQLTVLLNSAYFWSMLVAFKFKVFFVLFIIMFMLLQSSKESNNNFSGVVNKQHEASGSVRNLQEVSGSLRKHQEGTTSK